MHFRDLICYSALATLAVVATPGVAQQVPAPKWDKYAGERQGAPAKGGFHGHQAREAEANNHGWMDSHGQPYNPHAPHHARDAASQRPSQTGGAWTKPSEWASWLSSQLPKVTGSAASHPTAPPTARPSFAPQHGQQHGPHHARDADAGHFAPPQHYQNHGNSHHARDAETEAGRFNGPPQHYQPHNPHHAREAEAEAEPGKYYAPPQHGQNHGSNGHHARDAEAEPVNFPARPAGKFDHASDWHRDFLAAHGVKHNARDALADEDVFDDNTDFSNDGYVDHEEEEEQLQARDAAPEPKCPAHPEGKDFDHNSDWHKAFLKAHGVKHQGRDAEPEAEPVNFPARPAGKFDHASDWHKEFLAAHGVKHNARDVETAPEFAEDNVDASDNGYELTERDAEEGGAEQEPLSFESYGAEDEDKLFARDARNAFQPGAGAHPTVNNDWYDSQEHADFLARHGIKLNVPSSAAPEATEAPAVQARFAPPKPKQYVPPTKPAVAKPSKGGFGGLKFPW